MPLLFPVLFSMLYSILNLTWYVWFRCLTRVSVECHTLAFGNCWWIDECLPTIQTWCGAHGYPLKIWGDSETVKLPSRKFIARRIWEEFAAGPNEWCLWVDADVWIHPDSPDLISELTPGFWLAHDPSHALWNPNWRRWCASNRLPRPRADWIYRNAGVWVLHKQVVGELLKVSRPPFIVGVQEQHHLNLWASLMQEKLVSVLPHHWNAMVPRDTDLQQWHGGWFIHLLSRKEDKWKRIQNLGGPQMLRPQNSS